MEIENVARFTAQQVADAAFQAYGPSVKVEVISGTAGLYYSLTLVNSKAKPLMLSCAHTTLEQVFLNVSRLIEAQAKS